MQAVMILVLAALALLAGCGRDDALDNVRDRGELRVVTRNSPTTYFFDKSGATGYEYALVRRLASELGVDLRITVAEDLPDLFRMLQRGEVDLAAAGLTLTAAREERFNASIPYGETPPIVIYRAGTFRPRSLSDLSDQPVLVAADSSHAQSLQALREGGHDDLVIRQEPLDSLDLMAMVDSQEAPFAVVDEAEFKVLQSLYPRLRVAMDLGSARPLAWYLPGDEGQQGLLDEVNAFLERMAESGELASMRERHYGHAAGVSRIGSHTFTRNMRNNLPRYRDMIRQVAREYRMDWHLLAAIAYQESHWNPRATSPTGVRGMMMLTRRTARELDIENRLDPLQSLRGGARYLMDLKRRLPRDIKDPDRTWLALAAYNVGMGHLEDARILTEAAGGDPNLWPDVREQLPKLQKSQFYRDTRYGYARGQEAVTYVQNIRHYYSILEWQDLAGQQPVPPIDIDRLLPDAARDLTLIAL